MFVEKRFFFIVESQESIVARQQRAPFFIISLHRVNASLRNGKGVEKA